MGLSVGLRIRRETGTRTGGPRRVADLLRGRASRIRLEPPGRAGAGIEFLIEETDGIWCEQVKDVPSKWPWSLQ